MYSQKLQIYYRTDIRGHLAMGNPIVRYSVDRENDTHISRGVKRKKCPHFAPGQVNPYLIEINP